MTFQTGADGIPVIMSIRTRIKKQLSN